LEKEHIRENCDLRLDEFGINKIRNIKIMFTEVKRTGRSPRMDPENMSKN
jgi:hypothetical protein